jgi:hypothetical protein
MFIARMLGRTQGESDETQEREDRGQRSDVSEANLTPAQFKFVRFGSSTPGANDTPVSPDHDKIFVLIS